MHKRNREKKNTYQRFKYIARRNHFYKALFYTLVLPIITSFLLLPFFLERTYTHTHTRTQERICFSFLPMYFCSKNLQCMSGFISSILLHIFLFSFLPYWTAFIITALRSISEAQKLYFFQETIILRLTWLFA